jgi:chemotaxis protein methyltransferase CheR
MMRQQPEIDAGSAGRLDTASFDQLADFIHRTTGIKMPRSKRTMLEGRLGRRVVATGAASFDAYCRQVLAAPEDSDEVIHLLDAVTTNKTDFFREPDHFRALSETILPRMASPGKRISVWSAACSIGAEPYTLAMVLEEFRNVQLARGVRLPPPLIVATDLSTRILEAAHAGIFPASMAEPVPPMLRQRYFLRSREKRKDVVRIAPELRALVKFGRLNLMAERYDLPRDFDIIFCRNVLIYFERKDQAAVLSRLCDHLPSGGILAVGHSESIHGIDLPLEPVAHTMYRRH